MLIHTGARVDVLLKTTRAVLIHTGARVDAPVRFFKKFIFLLVSQTTRAVLIHTGARVDGPECPIFGFS